MSFSSLRVAGCSLAVLALTVSAFCQTPQFQAGEVEIDGQAYPYQLLVPAELVEGESYPLILFLHGAGERGDDNKAQIRSFPRRMKRLQDNHGAPCFVLAPQCPKGVWWTGPAARGSSSAAPSQPIPSMRAAIASLAEVVRAQPIDRDRIALTGLSMGGFGSWSMATRYPLLVQRGGADLWRRRRQSYCTLGWLADSGLARRRRHHSAYRSLPPPGEGLE